MQLLVHVLSKLFQRSMELPDEYTSFWSAQILPDTKCKVTVPEGMDCVLSNAAIGQESDRPESGRVVLLVKVNDLPEAAVVPFTLNVFESTMLDIQFSEGDVIEFSVQGECPIHIAGYITGGYALEIENPVGGPFFPPAPQQPEAETKQEETAES